MTTTGQNLDDFFQRPLDGPYPQQHDEAMLSTPLSMPQHQHTNTDHRPSYRSTNNPIMHRPSYRSFLATSMYEQQTAPHPYFAGPSGRKGRMLLGAGFEPPSEYTPRYREKMAQQKLIRSKQQQHQRTAIVSSTPTQNNRAIDRTTVQRYAFSPREREQAIIAMLAKSEGDGGRSRGYNAPRTQSPIQGSWNYKDKVADKRAGRRYRQYPADWDQPNPRRPMARTEEQMRRPKWESIQNTSLYAPRRQVDIGVIPSVKQTIFVGPNQYQARMEAARNHVGSLTTASGSGNIGNNSNNSNIGNNSNSSYIGGGQRMAGWRQKSVTQKLATRNNSLPPPNQRVPSLGPLAVTGRVNLVEKYEPSFPQFSRTSGPHLIPQGPVRGVMQRQAPASYNPVGPRFGQSLRHGRKDRVALWNSPLSRREL